MLRRHFSSSSSSSINRRTNLGATAISSSMMKFFSNSASSLMTTSQQSYHQNNNNNINRTNTIQLSKVFTGILSPTLSNQQRFCSTGGGGAGAGAADSSSTTTSRPPITVLWSPTPNTESIRFYSMELSFLPPGSTLDLPNEGHGYKSPLAELLWKQCPDIASLYFSDEYITVTKEVSSSWDDLTPLVKQAIVEFAHSGHNILTEEGEQELESGHPDTEPQPEDSEVLLAIKELLATRIRPMLAMDGGGMKFIAFEDGLVYLVLEGACKTCSSKGNTLKVGIERMLMHWIPEVAEVVEVDEMWAEDYKKQFEEEKKKLEEEKEKTRIKSGAEQTQEEREAEAAAPSAPNGVKQ